MGYYVRKFNKLAKKGKPIAIQWRRDKPDEETLAIQAFSKNITFINLMKMLGEVNGLDKVYKFLMVMKLFKELRRDIFPTQEERQAFVKHQGYIIEQIFEIINLTK